MFSLLVKKYSLKTIPSYSLENRHKYSNEELLKVWNESDSVNQFLLNLNVGTSGGAWYHYKKRLAGLEVDFSSSTINGRKRGGQKVAEIRNRECTKQRKRLARPILKKSMDLANIEYKCIECGIYKWREKKIKLHIHHKDLDKTNNLVSNLQYLCPNCHGISHYIEE